MPYSQQDILTQNINTYPNNNSGQITPDSVKTFNQNWIQSVVFTDQTGSMVVVSSSYAETAGTANTATATPNALVTASTPLLNNVIQFAKGDNSGFSVIIDNVPSASFASTASFLLGTIASASYALTASYALNAGGGGTVDTGSLVTTASFNAYTSSAATTFATKTELNSYTGSTNAFTASIKTFTGSIQTQVNALQAATSSYVKNAQTASMSVLSASFADTANNVRNGLNITASNITVLNNLTVNGTASFAYTKTTTGSAVVIGDAFIILNADTPTAPYAGIMVYDTGSASTASFEWNGNGDYWIAVEETGLSAGILTGPLAVAKGGETFPTLNKVLKGTGNQQLVDSNITDNGTNVSINSNTQITGSLSTTGDINIAQSSKLVAHDIQAANVAGLEINNNTGGTVALFGAGGSTGMTLYGQLNANAFSGSGALVTGVVSSSYATTASFALNAPQVATGSFATTGSNTFNGNQIISGSLDVTDTTTLGFVTILDDGGINFNTTASATHSAWGIATNPSNGDLVINSNPGNLKPISFNDSDLYIRMYEGVILEDGFNDFNTNTQALILTSSIAATVSLLDSRGSVLIKPKSTDAAASYPYTINQASDTNATGGNLIIARNSTATGTTGSINISGSNNIGLFSAGATNAAITAGSGSGFRGNNNIVTVAPVLGGTNGTGYAREVPTFTNSVINAVPTIADNRPSQTGTPLTFSSVGSNSTLTFTTSTGSATLGNSVLAGLNNQIIVTGSNGAAKSITSLNILGTANTASIESPSTAGNFVGVLMAGSLNTVYVSGSSSTLQASALLGYDLLLTGSAVSTANYGTVVVGRFNASGSVASQTAFEVGTGTSDTARRTSLHVSSSGLTTISNLSATGNLQGTASFATTASYVQGGGFDASSIYSYQFLLMGS
jgi:hypothetical protein